MIDDPVRRGLLGAGGALLGAGLIGGTAQAEARPRRSSRARIRFDVENPRHNLEAYIKMRGDTTGKPALGWYKGIVFGVRGRERLRPLFGFEGFGHGRYLVQPDGSYRQLWREIAVFTDLKTGAILDEWDNPYTGERVQVLDVQNDPINIVLSEKTPQIPPAPGRDLLFGNYNQGDRLVMPWMVDRAGDWACMFYDGHGVRTNPLPPAEWPRESSGPTLRVSEFIQYWARLSDLEDPSLTSVDTVGAWERVADWLPWMLMGGEEGSLFYRTGLRKLASVDQIPPHLVARAKARYPQYLVTPDTWTVNNVSSFEVFKKMRTPAPPRS